MLAPDDAVISGSARPVACEEDVLEEIAHTVDFDPGKLELVRRWIFDENRQRVIDPLMVASVPARCPACFTMIRFNALVTHSLLVVHPAMAAPASVSVPLLLTYPADIPSSVLDIFATAPASSADGQPPRADLRRRFAAQVGYHAWLNHCPRCQHAVHDVELFGGRGPFARQPGELVEFVSIDDIDRPVHSGVMLAVDVSESLARRISSTAGPAPSPGRPDRPARY